MAAADRIIVYQKPTCTTCRQLAKLLREAGIEYEAIDYLLDPIPRKELVRLHELGVRRHRVEDLVVGDLGPAESELVQRPIVVYGEKAILARPAERVREILPVG